jgi:hypothetical protein
MKVLELPRPYMPLFFEILNTERAGDILSFFIVFDERFAGRPIHQIIFGI